jgi:hypothetical protein
MARNPYPDVKPTSSIHRSPVALWTLYTTQSGSRRAQETNKDYRQLATKSLASQLIALITITILLHLGYIPVVPEKAPSSKKPAKKRFMQGLTT